MSNLIHKNLLPDVADDLALELSQKHGPDNVKITRSPGAWERFDVEVVSTRKKPSDQVLSALLKAAEKVGRGSQESYLSQIKRGRKGQVTHGYTLSEPHQRLMETIDAYSHGTINDEEAMAVLHEYDVMKARFPSEREPPKKNADETLLAEAIRDWRAGRAHMDRAGKHFHLAQQKKRAPWDAAVKRAGWTSSDLHEQGQKLYGGREAPTEFEQMHGHDRVKSRLAADIAEGRPPLPPGTTRGR